MVLLVMLTAAAFAASPQAAGAPEPALSAEFDRESAPVGGRVTLTLTYRLPEGAAVSEGTPVKGLEELAVLNARFQPGRIRFEIMIDRIGSLSTGPISLAYRDAGGKLQSLDAAPLSVTVLSNLGEKPQEVGLRPIRGIVSTRSRWLAYRPWVLGAAGLALLCAGLYWAYRRFFRKDRKGPLPDLPHILAEKALEDLEARGLFDKGAVKAHYFRLSEILRQYLEAIRGFPAAEYTTEEIARRVSRPEDLNLVPLLRAIDLIKFADDVPTRARKEETHRAALSYVRETAPSPAGDDLSSRESVP